VILDVMLPGCDGFSLLPEIRTLGVPVIFLTAKDRLEDKVYGLNLGADDYLVKPFSALELAARVEAVLRRTEKADEVIRIDQVEIRPRERLVLREGREVPLTAQEYDLLLALVENRNLALSREQLLGLAWGYDFLGDTRTVDVHIQKLRKKLGLGERIKTVFKHGYRLEVPRRP